MPPKKTSNSQTDLSKHKLIGKRLLPPMAQIPQMQRLYWRDDRLPEMLWAVLLVDAFSRVDALARFDKVVRAAAGIVGRLDPDWRSLPAPVTISGIAGLQATLREEVVSAIVSDDEACKALAPMLLLDELPGKDAWASAITGEPGAEAWNQLANAVARASFHQSQEATDCRWVMPVFMIASGTIQFNERTAEAARLVVEYPTHDEEMMRRSRPSVRSMEGGLGPMQGETEWPERFWRECYEHTECLPHDYSDEDLKALIPPQDQLILDRKRLHDISQRLTDCFWATSATTAFDSRHEVAFGITLYAAELVTGAIASRLGRTAHGRIVLRTLAECLISLTHLAKKDDPGLWEAFRKHGEGQAKLVCQRSEEEDRLPSYLDPEKLGQIANDDQWVEFLPVTIGHWDSSDLRKMAIGVNLKDVYDDYYTWPSSYSHGQWGAMRESVYHLCGNPLHRFHRIPLLGPALLLDCRDDFYSLLGRITDVLYSLYPDGKEDSVSGDQNRNQEARRP